MKRSILRQSPFSLRIVERYLLQEMLGAFVAAGVILLLVTMGGAVADLLARIARGRIPADLLFVLVGLRTVGALSILLPLAVLIGVLLAIGRLWRDSEMAVLQSSGLAPAGLVRLLALFVVPVALLLALVAFWLAPAADRLANQRVLEANRSLIVAGLEPGRFVELPGREGVIHVGEMSADGTRFARMFIESERPDAGSGGTRLDVITATHGFLYHDADGSGRYIALQDGFRVEGTLGQDDYRLMRFERNDIRLPDNAVEDAASTSQRSASTAALLQAGPADPAARAELHWRLASPLSVLVLALLALPLARSSPREPRYARLLLALLAWLTYYNLLVLGRTWIAEGTLAPALGLWWVHLPVSGLAAWMLWSSRRLRATPRAAGAA
jgi:lipopolysaccharide export system permease protein